MEALRRCKQAGWPERWPDLRQPILASAISIAVAASHFLKVAAPIGRNTFRVAQIIRQQPFHKFQAEAANLLFKMLEFVHQFNGNTGSIARALARGPSTIVSAIAGAGYRRMTARATAVREPH